MWPVYLIRFFYYVLLPSIAAIVVLLSGDLLAALVTFVLNLLLILAIAIPIELLFTRVSELRGEVDRLRAETDH